VTVLPNSAATQRTDAAGRQSDQGAAVLQVARSKTEVRVAKERHAWGSIRHQLHGVRMHANMRRAQLISFT
jgi:hypothetical protein